MTARAFATTFNAAWNLGLQRNCGRQQHQTDIALPASLRDPGELRLPAATDEQIRDWVDRFLACIDEGDSHAKHQPLVAAATAVLSNNAVTLAALVVFTGCTSPSIAPNDKADDSTFKQLSVYDADFQDLLKSLHDPVFQDLLTKTQRNGGCAIPVC